MHIENPDEAPAEFSEHAKTTKTLRAEAKMFEVEAAKLEGRKVQDGEEFSSGKAVMDWMMEMYAELHGRWVSAPEKVYDWEVRRETGWEQLVRMCATMPMSWALAPGNAHEEGCPCGQAVSGRLLNLYMVLLTLWVLHSLFS